MQHLEVEEACEKSMCGPQFIYVYTGRVVTHRLVTLLSVSSHYHIMKR